ncbi:MAG: flagellar basal body P-ring protein FlgI [bacterium]|nr:flagellar basal body P-ring protein FlgI [bacterium]
MRFSQNPSLRLLLLALLLLAFLAQTQTVLAANESRIKDLARLQGTTPEPLTGHGLVVGLNGDGDPAGSEAVHNMVRSMLEKHNVTAPLELITKNTAAVMVSASIDPTARIGSTIDVKVSSLYGANSLEGGTLIMTPLMDHKGNLVVLAEGSVSIGGFNIKSGAGNSFRKNHAQVGTIPNGGIVKVKMGGSYTDNNTVTWLLAQPDFSTADQMAQVINSRFGMKLAKASGASSVDVMIPDDYKDNPVPFLADMGKLETKFDAVAKVVVNERTGTIIVGKNVKLREAAVAHGTLKVVVNTYYDVSQPGNFSRVGNTVVTPDVETDVEDREARVLRVPDTSTVADVVGVLNDIGASPRDIIAILEALKRAGSLQAELVIM